MGNSDGKKKLKNIIQSMQKSLCKNVPLHIFDTYPYKALSITVLMFSTLLDFHLLSSILATL